jgi:hypothetical protein
VVPGTQAVKIDAAEGRKTDSLITPSTNPAGNAEPAAPDAADARAASILERMKAAESVRDPLEYAERLVPLLDEMTAEDFGTIGADRIMSALYFGRYDYRMKEAVSLTWVRRWVELDRDGAAKSLLAPGHNELSETLARVYPEAVIERCLLRDSDLLNRDQCFATAFQALAMRDTAFARRLLDRVTDPDMHRTAKTSIALGIAESDPVTAMVCAREVGGYRIFQAALASAKRMGPGVLRQVLELNAEKFPPEIMDLAFHYPDVDWDSYWPEQEFDVDNVDPVALRVALRMDAAERADLLERLQHSSGSMTNGAIAGVVAAWAARDPKAAANWAAARAKPEDADEDANSALNQAIQFWLVSDKAAALQWLSEQPDSELHRDLMMQAAERLSETLDLSQIKELVPSQLRDLDRGRINRIVQMEAEKDPKEVAAWLMSIPTEAVTNETTNFAMRLWTARDPKSAAEWLDALPTGRRRDQFVRGFANAVSVTDSEAADHWIETIQSPEIQRWAIRDLFNAIGGQDPDEAIDWINSRTDIDERYRGALIRSMK